MFVTFFHREVPTPGESSAPTSVPPAIANGVTAGQKQREEEEISAKLEDLMHFVSEITISDQGSATSKHGKGKSKNNSGREEADKEKKRKKSDKKKE